MIKISRMARITPLDILQVNIMSMGESSFVNTFFNMGSNDGKQPTIFIAL